MKNTLDKILNDKIILTHFYLHLTKNYYELFYSQMFIFSGEKIFTIKDIEPTVGPKSGGNVLHNSKIFFNFLK